MPVFSSTNLTRFQRDGEQNFAAEFPCVIERISLSITSGTSQYVLPDSVANIRRMTYRGWKVWPLPHRDLRESFLNGQQSGRPYWYIFNNIGLQKIQLFPVPQENLDAIQTGLWGESISDHFIIEFYAIPDQEQLKIPHFIRRRLLKTYTAMRMFQSEGRGQNTKAYKYWAKKWDFAKATYGEALADLNNKPRNLIANEKGMNPYGFTPPPPILPVSRFGIAVDDISG